MLASKSLNRWGIYAIFFGIFTGIFFGPLAAEFLKPFANAFSMLLQMAVFPYISISLIFGMLSMTSKDLFRLLRRGLPFIIGLWAIAIFFVFFLTQVIPDPLPPFYSVKMENGGGEAAELIFQYLVPENGIYALANNKILAGLAFSLFFGAALMTLEQKEFLIPYLERSLEILELIFGWLRLISPIGVFIYIAMAFGIIELEDMSSIRYYLFGLIFVYLFFSLIIIPTIICNFTEISRNQIFKAIQEVCLFPFLCASPSLLLPFLVLYCKKGSEQKEQASVLKMILPIAYCISQVGSAVFIFISSFLCFYYRFSMSFLEQMMLYFRFAPISFGEPTRLFNDSFFGGHFNLPITATEIDSEESLITHHFLVLMSAVSVLAAVLLIQATYSGKLQNHWKRLFGSLTVFSFLFIAIIYVAKPFIHMDDYYEGIYQNRKISDVLSNPVNAKLLSPGEIGSPRDPMKPTLSQIVETGVLKVGIEDYEIPFSYLNNFDEIAGYDIAYAYQLARDLDCSLEFVLVDPDRLGEQLIAGEFDIGMSSFLMTENRLKTMEFSLPSYKEEENVLVIPRAKKSEFMNLKNIQDRNLKILTRGAYKEIAEKYFPNAQVISFHGFSPLRKGEVDACLWSRTSGFIWCILNPEFIVVDYGDSLGKSYIAYPFRENALAFASFLDNWLKVKEQIGFKKKMIEYWIQGLPPEKSQPRWSVLKDVLHLVK